MTSQPSRQSPDITFEQIRERAYDLWERHHRPEGFSIELWLMAERELKAERLSRMQDDAASPDRPEPGTPSR